MAGPLLIAYSFGYTINLQKGELTTTGGIFIKSKTPRLSIFLDGTFIKETSYLSGGALLTDIMPGSHHLRIEKQSYYPWSATVSVEPTMVTDMRNILLIPNPPTIATSTPDEIAAIRASVSLPSSRMIAPKETISVATAPVNTFLSSFSVDSARNLIQKTATTTLRVVPHVNSFGVIDTFVYFIDKNGFLGRFDPGTGAIITIGRPGFYLSDTMAQFSGSPDGTIIILDASGGLFLSDGATTIQTVTGGVRQFSLDAKGQKVLLRKDQEINILWLEDNTFQPFQKHGTRDQIYASDGIIQDADWFFGDNAHIVIGSQNGILFTDIDPRNGKNTVILFDRKPDEIVTIPDIPQSLFFRKGKNYYTIPII